MSPPSDVLSLPADVASPPAQHLNQPRGPLPADWETRSPPQVQPTASADQGAQSQSPFDLLPRAVPTRFSPARLECGESGVLWLDGEHWSFCTNPFCLQPITLDPGSQREHYRTCTGHVEFSRPVPLDLTFLQPSTHEEPPTGEHGYAQDEGDEASYVNDAAFDDATDRPQNTSINGNTVANGHILPNGTSVSRSVSQFQVQVPSYACFDLEIRVLDWGLEVQDQGLLNIALTSCPNITHNFKPL